MNLQLYKRSRQRWSDPQNWIAVSTGVEQVWRSRYHQAIKRLEAEVTETVSDLEAGADLYVSLRYKWNHYVVALAKYMAYEWSAIAPVDSYHEQLLHK